MSRSGALSSGSGSGAGLAGGLKVAAIGDSLTANGYLGSVMYVGTAGTTGNQSILSWAIGLSKGRLVPAKGQAIFATGGFTSAQVISTHLTPALASDADVIVVLAGTNDPNAATGDIATTVANLTTIYDAIKAAGKTAVACTLPPRNDMSSWGYSRVNAWIRREAAKRRIPLADYFPALADPATFGAYLSGNPAPGVNNIDNVHPNGKGAKILGQVLCDALLDTAPRGAVPLETKNVRGANETWELWGNRNPLNLGTLTAGRPSDWAVQYGTPGSEGVETDASTIGQYYTLTRGAADAGMQKTVATVVAGHRMWFAVRLKATVEAVGGSFRARLQTLGSGVTTYHVGILEGREDLPAGFVLCGEFTVPAGDNQAYWQIEARSALNATISTAQLRLIDLDAAGI